MAALAQTGGTGGSGIYPATGSLTVPDVLRHVYLGEHERMSVGTSKSVADGVPSPCVAVRGRYGRAWRLRVPVKTGTYSVSCKVKPESAGAARPSVAILENQEIGIAGQTATAGAGSGWMTVGPMTFTATGDGGIEVELRTGDSEFEATALFDDLQVVLTEPFKLWFQSIPVLGYRRYAFKGWINGAPIPDDDFAFNVRRRAVTVSFML